MHYNQDDIATGERLRGIRESMKMTREEFSEKIDTGIWQLIKYKIDISIDSA